MTVQRFPQIDSQSPKYIRKPILAFYSYINLKPINAIHDQFTQRQSTPALHLPSTVSHTCSTEGEVLSGVTSLL